MLFRAKPPDLTHGKKPSMRELRLYEVRKSKPFILDVALEYKRMIDSGEVKSQAELARKLGLSRARVTQVLNVLKIYNSDSEFFSPLINNTYLTERKLRGIKSSRNS